MEVEGERRGEARDEKERREMKGKTTGMDNMARLE